MAWCCGGGGGVSPCRLTFDDGRAHYQWDHKMESLLEVVAEHL